MQTVLTENNNRNISLQSIQPGDNFDKSSRAMDPGIRFSWLDSQAMRGQQFHRSTLDKHGANTGFQVARRPFPRQPDGLCSFFGEITPVSGYPAGTEP
jgi:hypothetical protein